MSEELNIIENEDGTFSEYDDTFDITIHCQSEEEQNEVLAKLNAPQPKMGRWVKTPKAIMGEGYMWYCDKCKYEVYQDSSRPYPSEKFCPNCGSYNGGDTE